MKTLIIKTTHISQNKIARLQKLGYKVVLIMPKIGV